MQYQEQIETCVNMVAYMLGSKTLFVNLSSFTNYTNYTAHILTLSIPRLFKASLLTSPVKADFPLLPGNFDNSTLGESKIIHEAE